MAYATVNPYTNEVIQTFPYATDADVDAALDKAQTAYTTWSRTPVEERAVIFRRAAELLRERAVELGELATLEMGKLSSEAALEASRLTAPLLDWLADHGADILRPRKVENTGVPRDVALTFAPQGIVYSIEPWNVPYYQAVRGFAPAAISGNVVILKHAANVPQCAATIVELLREAGLPDGVWQNIYATHEQSDRIIADPRIRAITLTGSARVGSHIASLAGKALRPAVMELGGSDAFVVLPDADLDAALEGTQFRFFNAGQVCVSPKRMIIADSVYDEFLARFIGGLADIRPGDPTDPETSLAPLSSQAAADQVRSQIAAAVAAGATATEVGHPIPSTGAFVQPTVLTNVSKDNPAFYDEIFGPIPIIFSVPDVESAVALANDSIYGLAGSVWSRDVDQAIAVANQLDTGNVAINSTRISGSPAHPFGGVKASGFGKEMGIEGVLEFVNQRTITLPEGTPFETLL
jgi:succinate-semialdehyde dehydrogenase/glutarate-semialdehyde dehydrogenase